MGQVYQSEFTEGARVTLHLTNGETHYAILVGYGLPGIEVDTIRNMPESAWVEELEYDTVTRYYPWPNILWIEYWGHEVETWIPNKEATP